MRPTVQIFWRIVYAIFPTVRDLLLRLGIIWHSKDRQPFPIGNLREDVIQKVFRERLVSFGFEKNILAWIDYGEVLSMRKADPIRPGYHYHIRLFVDGEVRGHYEKMPEWHPIDHFLERGMLNRADYFRSIIGDMLEGAILSPFSDTKLSDLGLVEIKLSGKTRSHKAPAVSRRVPTKGYK